MPSPVVGSGSDDDQTRDKRRLEPADTTTRYSRHVHPSQSPAHAGAFFGRHARVQRCRIPTTEQVSDASSVSPRCLSTHHGSPFPSSRPSLRRARARCHRTVTGEMPSSAATRANRLTFEFVQHDHRPASRVELRQRILHRDPRHVTPLGVIDRAGDVSGKHPGPHHMPSPPVSCQVRHRGDQPRVLLSFVEWKRLLRTERPDERLLHEVERLVVTRTQAPGETKETALVDVEQPQAAVVRGIVPESAGRGSHTLLERARGGKRWSMIPSAGQEAVFSKSGREATGWLQRAVACDLARCWDSGWTTLEGWCARLQTPARAGSSVEDSGRARAGPAGAHDEASHAQVLIRIRPVDAFAVPKQLPMAA